MLEKLKSAYLLWVEYHSKIPKTHRYSLGGKIDTLFIETIEAIVVASFLSRAEKQPYVGLAIRKLDTLKVLLLVAWEAHALETKRFVALSKPLEEVGKMLGGWNGQLTKQNSAPTRGAEK